MKDNIFIKLWRCLYVPVLYFAVMLIVQYIAMFGYMVVVMVADMSIDERQLVELTTEWLIEQSVMLTIVSGVIMLPLLILMMKRDKKRLIRADKYEKYEQVAPIKWLYIVIIGAAACIGFNILIEITGIINWGGGFEDTSEAIYGGNPLVMVLGVVFLIPLVEELVFRGVVYERIRQYGGAKVAILLSAVYFGLFHMNVPQGIYAFAIGLIIAWIYYKYKSVWAPVLFHVSANGISVVLTFTPFLSELNGVGVIVLCVAALLVTALMIYLISRSVKPECISEQYDTIVVGAGFAGAVVARELAEYADEKVLIIEKRPHIGGNCFDSFDKHGVLVHNYGPHIFHTNNRRVYDYLSKYTEWYNYQHEVGANIHGKIVPVPFNINTLYAAFEKEEAESLEKVLIEKYGEGSRVPVLELMQSEDESIQKVGKYVYENIFLQYTMKQWGQKPEEVDPSVTARVPVVLSRDNRYFQDTYQGMPQRGYTPLFANMLNHKNIKVKLNTDAKNVVSLIDKKVYYNGKPFEGKVIFTGPIDEFFDCKFGKLPYRSLRFEWGHSEADSFQAKAVINYTVSEDYTRITEFKKLTGQLIKGTTVMREYSIPYTDSTKEIPYYAILNDENKALYEKYLTLLNDYPNFYLLGRLAEYKYYNIDAIVDEALKLADKFINAR